MDLNGLPIEFKINDENNLLVSFGPFQGTLNEILDFRRSFDYECYAFGKGRFMSASWLTIKADDKDHCKYPRVITVKSEEVELTMSWSELNNLIAAANVYFSEHVKKLNQKDI